MATAVPNQPPDLHAHDITVKEQPQFTRSGTVEMHTLVTFYVGHHGPFIVDLLPGQYSPEVVNAKIANKVSELRAITSRTY